MYSFPSSPLIIPYDLSLCGKSDERNITTPLGIKSPPFQHMLESLQLTSINIKLDTITIFPLRKPKTFMLLGHRASRFADHFADHFAL